MKSKNKIINGISQNRDLIKPNKTTVDKYGAFTFINSNNGIVTKERIHDSINYLKNHILRLYLKRVQEFKVDDKFWNSNCTDKNVNVYLNEINDFISSISSVAECDETIWKISSNDGSSIYFCMYKDQLVNKEFRVGMIMIIFDNKTEVATIHNMTVDRQGAIHFSNMILGPFYLSKKDYYIDNVIKQTNAKNIKTIPANIIGIIHQCLKLYNEFTIYNLSFNQMKEHSSLELKIFNKLMNSDDDEINRCININSWENRKNDISRFDDKFYNIISLSIPKFIYNEDSEYPIVDFSKREWKFINKYIEEKGIVDSEGNKYFNLAEVVNHPRYGSTLKMVFLNDGSSYDCYTSFYYDKNNDVIRFFICNSINKDITVFSFVDYENISKFNPNDNIIDVETNIYINKGSSLFRSIDEARSAIPKLFLDYNNILDAAMSIIGVHVILFDRPDRSRMIKEVRKCNSLNHSSPNKDKSSKNPNNDMIIKHILMPKKEAKEYINIAANNGEIYREYVTEQWERKGYYRKIPNSDKMIYIKPTICKRHLELTKDKEIRIKL